MRKIMLCLCLLCIGEANANWIAFDNVKLSYLGNDEESDNLTNVDVTEKVNKDGWIVENGRKNTVTIDGIAMTENYQDNSATTGVVLWQDVIDLENGNYTVELWANARVAWVASTATDGQEDLTYLVANNVEIPMKVFLNPNLNSNATYVLEGVDVTDGTLHIEMNKKSAGSNWHTIQIKSLTLHVSNDEALKLAKVDLKAALETAAVVPATDALTAAIAAAQNVYDTSKSVNEVNATVASLKLAVVLAVNTNAVAGATVSAPVVTNFVVNGTFDTDGVTAPWKTTTNAQNQTTATNQQGAFTGNFFENWNPSNYTGKIYQVIENIPNGLYELSICAFVNDFVAGAHYVYANADKKKLATGVPTAYTVRTTVTDNVIEIGLEQVEAVNKWMGIDNVSLKYFGEVDENYAKDIYASTKAAAEALLTEKMSPEAHAILEAALAVEVDETSAEALIAAEADLQEAMNSVKVSVNFYANNKKAIDAMFTLLNSTNVYTIEAYETYKAKAEDFLVQYETGALNATVDNPTIIHGWHASVDYDDFLLSAFGVKDFDTNLYINTWSTEGENDGSEFKVPFFECWVGDGESLAATTKTATVTGLTPGKYYSVEAWIRTRAKNGVAAADATGITLAVGTGKAVDVTKGTVIGESQFAHAVYTALGQADEKGNLAISFEVLAGNNVSWLSFKNLKYTEVEVAEPQYLTVVEAKVGDVAIVNGAAEVTSISTIDLVFDRPVALTEDADCATLTNMWGDTSLKAEVLEENNCVVRFSLQWNVYPDAGDYYLYIPEGLIVGVEDANYINSKITTTITISARGQTSYDCIYWFDNDMALGGTATIQGGSWQTDIDVSGLDMGLHSLHMQVQDALWSSPVTRHFIRQHATADGMRYHYWFDNDNDTMVESNEELTWFDVTVLDDGLHMLHVMAEGTTATQTLSYQFLKIPQTDGVEFLHCLCYLNGKLYHQERVASSGGIVHWEFDVSGLPQGIHNIQVQTVTPSGAATGLYESMFLRTTTSAEMASLKCFYTIDGAESYIEAGTYADGAFHFDLDVSTLDDGLHQLAYMLVGDNGVSTKVSSAFFMKTPLGGNGITQYWYWLNDDDDNKTVVKLDERTNPFQLIGLLPVESVPIRSSLFHFEVDEEQGPMVYAKNEFHIRFYDATGRLVDATKQYVDPEVKEKVAEVSPLLKTQTMSKTGENEIRWYKFVAQVGDSVAFKTNKACSINVFSADGTEIYAVSGSESVNFGGSVIAEDGTYYVALHDVTATRGENVILDFFHVGKYAVLEYSPDCIGLLGESFAEIKLFGNGYDKLKRAYLQSPTSVLQPDSIAILNRMNAKMVYSFDESVELGLYDIVLEFEEEGESETLVIENAVTIENGEWIEPEVTVSSERSLARPYPVKVTVKNSSNVGMVYVPLNIAFDKVDAFDRVDFMNFSMMIPDTALVGDYRPFFVTEDFLGEGIRALVMYLFIPQLNPGETKEYVLGFTGPSHARFNMYAWAGEALNHPNPSVDTLTNIPSMWYYLEEYGYLDEEPSAQNIPMMNNNRISSSARMYNARSRILQMIRNSVGDAMDAADNAVGIGMAIGGIENGLRRNSYEASLRAAGYGPGDPMWDEVMGHVGPMPTPDEIRGGIRGLWQFSRRTRPRPRPNPTEILNPGDPNDIIGYSAESGSKYVKEGLVDVGYTIQFENDPEIATAAAHKIVVKDTLDGNLFDLSTFAATGVLLGDKRIELNGEKSFVRTIDMRTRINVIAEVSLDYDETSGIATWTIRSLDPMTMEETWDYMQGVLPVNYDGNGQGELYFDIKLREGLPDGTEIPNRASITFDFEEAIITPTWTNIVDGVCPESCVTDVTYKNDSIVTLSIKGSDERSGIWKYDLYVQYGVGAPWIKEAELVADSTEVDFRIYDGLYYGFCALATDSAGNVEQKVLQPEVLCAEIHLGDVNSDGVVNEQDAQLTMDYYLDQPVAILAAAADVNEDGVVNTLDVTLIVQMYKNAENATESAPVVRHYYTIRR